MKVLQLTDNVLLGFARDIRFRRTVPQFDRLYRSIGKKSGCRCRKKQGSLGVILASIKLSVVRDKGLAQRIKSLTNSSTLVVHVREGNAIVRKEL